jgi:cytochrome oxidase Cu insertion factor (SCO1/SenC/PrrC family)
MMYSRFNRSVLAALVVSGLAVPAAKAQEPGAVETGKIGTDYNLLVPFSLLNADGKAVRASDFPGKWLLIYFGYTHCADLCPTALSQMTSALDQLGTVANNFQPIFVSIDPARDHGPALRQYTQSFDQRLLGLTGAPEQIEQFAGSVGVRFSKVLLPDDDYVIDHSATLTLIAPDLHHATTFKLGEAYRIAATLVAALDRAGVPIAGANNIGAYR